MIRVEKTHLPVAALTHPGMKGKNNEDRFGVSAFRIKTQPVTPVLLAVLSDGIGGNRAGEVASEMAVNLISKYVAASDGLRPLQTIEAAIHMASQQIYQQAQDNPDQHGMGATCACVWIAGDRLYSATVGDSRIYLMRAGTIQQLSTDHTWIQEALEQGLIQPEEAIGHPNAHVIRRYLGSPTPPEVDFRIRFNNPEGDTANPENQGMLLLPDDHLLLCSDGLTDLVSPDEIQTAYNELTLEEAGQKLIDLANQRGGHDNITLVAIQIPEVGVTAAAVPVSAMPLKTRPLLAGCLGVILFAALLGALAGGWFLYSGGLNPTLTQTATTTLVPSSTPFAQTRTVTPFRTPSPTASPTLSTSRTPTRQPLVPGVSPSLTPWPTNTPVLPVVTVSR